MQIDERHDVSSAAPLRTIRPGDQPRPHDGALLVLDIVDSTGLLRRLGDWAFLEVIEAFEALVEEVELRHGSVGADHTGDGFILVYPDVAAALAAAVDVFASMADLAVGPGCRPPDLRAGLHAGEIILRRKRLVGAVVYEAHALGNAAGANELWVSADARSQLSVPVLPPPSPVDLPRSGQTEVTIMRP